MYVLWIIWPGADSQCFCTWWGLKQPHQGQFCGVFAPGASGLPSDDFARCFEWGFWQNLRSLKIMTRGNIPVFLPLVRPKTTPPGAVLRGFCPWWNSSPTHQAHFCPVFVPGQPNITHRGQPTLIMPLVIKFFSYEQNVSRIQWRRKCAVQGE